MDRGDLGHICTGLYVNYRPVYRIYRFIHMGSTSSSCEPGANTEKATIAHEKKGLAVAYQWSRQMAGFLIRHSSVADLGAIISGG
jgi:hypothetical protein